MLGICYSLPSSTLPGWQEGLADSWVDSLGERCWATYWRGRGEQWERSNWHILNKKNFEPFMWILRSSWPNEILRKYRQVLFCYIQQIHCWSQIIQSRMQVFLMLKSSILFLWTDQQRFRSGRTPLRILPHPHWREMKASQTTPHNENTSSRPNGLWATAFVPWLANLFRAQPPNCVACLATQYYSKN